MNQISLGFSKAWSVRLVLRQREMESLHTNEREHLSGEGRVARFRVLRVEMAVSGFSKSRAWYLKIWLSDSQ